MFYQPFLYLYIASAVFTYAMQLTSKKINPKNPIVLLLMNAFGLISNIANTVFLIIYAINADHWWYALIAGALGFIASILLPPARIEMILGYLGIIGAPLCTTLAYINLFNII